MANGKVNITLKSGFDPRGIMDASRSIDKLIEKLHTANADLSRAIRQYAANSVIDYQREADKGVVHTVLSAKQIEEAWRKAMSQTVDGAKSGWGKIQNIAQAAISAIGGKFKSFMMEFARGGIWGAAAHLIIKLFSMVADKVSEAAEIAAKRVERVFNESLTSIKEGADAIDKAFESAMSGVDKAISRFDAMTNSVKALTKAEIELAKQHAIANGMDPEAANAAAADLSAQIDFDTEEDRLRNLIALEQERVNKAKDAEKKTAEAVAKATAQKKAAENALTNKREEYIDKYAIKAGDNLVVGDMGSVEATPEDERRSREAYAKKFEESDEAEKLREDVRKAEDALNGIKTDEKAIAAAQEALEKIKNAQIALDSLQAKREARELAVQNEIAAKVAEDQKKRAEADAALEKKSADEKIAAEQAAAKERERLEREAHARRMADIREEMNAQKAAAEPLRTVAAAAQSEFDKAFAMYRDPSRAAAEIGEEKDYQNDLERLHRDARQYGGKWRIDELSRLMSAGDTQGVTDALNSWRKTKGFTPEIEAMVRASAAEKTKTTAEDELRKVNDKVASMSEVLKQMADAQSGKLGAIADSTSGLAAKVDQLLRVKG